MTGPAGRAETLAGRGRFLSLVLRHRPDLAHLRPDPEGWVAVDDLVAGAARAGMALGRDLVREIVATDDKRRFALSEDGARIRAVQGHSHAGLRISYPETQPPARLWHGTARRFLDAIRAEGLRPGGRHHVHLSPDPDTARGVGSRHGAPAVLAVEAGRMHAAGYRFHRAENGVWLTLHVPPGFIAGGDLVEER